MNDKEFFELQLRATIVPQQVRWPAPEHLHWQRLHAAANDARDRVRKAYMQMDEIDRSTAISPEDKYRQRGKTAAQAIADFEDSKTLTRAREAIERVVKNEKQSSPERAKASDAALKAVKEAERGWQRAIDKIAERAGLKQIFGTRR